MKTKNKLFAWLEIAIVLCSLFLVALPTIAAEQNQTTQKVSASAITTASKDEFHDYTRSALGIYGNANEDDTIDMRDLTYVKLIFFGKKPETELADAKYDGKINPLDFIQIKLIIVGKEKELTFEDTFGEAVTVNKPVKRIVITMPDSAEVLRALNAADKIVGGTKYLQDRTVYFPELSKLPCIGAGWWSLDYEAILNLNPNVFLPFGVWPGRGGEEKKKEFKEKLPGVTIICLDLDVPEKITKHVKKLGYILDSKDEAEKYINWHEGWINEIKSRTDGLSEDEKPRVFSWSWYKPGGGYTTCTDSRTYDMTIIAGGKNIAAELPVRNKCQDVDAEWVIEQNPDIIFAPISVSCGYGTDDPSEMAAIRDDILNRPELANVNAGKSKRVYTMDYINLATAGSGSLIGTAYLAKLFHPDIFGDLDPKAIHQEYVTRFQHLDFNVYKHGVFVYPPLED